MGVCTMGKLSRRGFVGSVAAAGVAAATARTAAALAATPPSLLDDRMASAAAWGAFLGGQDLLWTRVPANWFDGPFLGNGFLGALVFRPGGTGALQVVLGHG